MSTRQKAKYIISSVIVLISVTACASLFVRPEELPPLPSEIMVGVWSYSYEEYADTEGYIMFSSQGFAYEADKMENGKFVPNNYSAEKWKWDDESKRIILFQPDSYEKQIGQYYEAEFVDRDHFLFYPKKFDGNGDDSDAIYLQRVTDFMPGNEILLKKKDFTLAGKWFASEEGFYESGPGEMVTFSADGESRGWENIMWEKSLQWFYDYYFDFVVFYDEEMYDYEFFTVQTEDRDKIVLRLMYDDFLVYLQKIRDPYTAEQEAIAAENLELELLAWKEDRIAYNELLNSRQAAGMSSAGIAAAKDTKPPEIEILSPDTERGLKIEQKEAVIAVHGRAVDENGIFEVIVNGTPARVQENGEFFAEVKLAYGSNTIRVSATDPSGNAGLKQFEVDRAADQYAPALSSNNASVQGLPVLGDYYALIIGIEDYKDNSVTDLDHPIDDAEKIRDVLVSKYTFNAKNITFLQNPDRKKIIQSFHDLRNKVTENDSLFIFYAGHGFWDEDMRQGYWLPSNAAKNDPSEWLANSTIRDYIRGMKTKHTLMVSDACFSGGIFKTRDAFIDADASIQKIYQMPSRKAITSGALNTVPDKSVFVEYLLKRLSENTEKYLYSEKLFISFKDAVINNSPVNQTPLFGVIGETGDEGGDFIFIRK